MASDIFEKAYDKDVGYFPELRARDDHYYIQPILEGRPGPRMLFEGKEVLVWSLNSYLGLHDHKLFRQAECEALSIYGSHSPMGSRLLTGNSREHEELEQRLASFLNSESANLYPNGYLGVMGAIQALLSPQDYIVVDSGAHACIVDGAMLTGRTGMIRSYKHNDINDLEFVLKQVQRTRKGGVLVVTEGIFGMTSDGAPLRDIVALKQKYEFRLLVDDAHGIGVLGPHGRGLADLQGVSSDIDLLMGTLAKAFSGFGGFSVSNKVVRDYLHFNVRTAIFTKSIPHIYVKTALACLDILQREGSDRRRRLIVIRDSLRKKLCASGFDVGMGPGIVTPVYLKGDLKEAGRVVKTLRNQGIFVSVVVFPVVPKGTILMRLVPTFLHNEEDIEETVCAFNNI